MRNKFKYHHVNTLGTTRKFNSPTFTNVRLMPSNQTIEPITAGVTYSLYCSRGVTIRVYVQIA